LVSIVAESNLTARNTSRNIYDRVAVNRAARACFSEKLPNITMKKLWHEITMSELIEYY